MTQRLLLRASSLVKVKLSTSMIARFKRTFPIKFCDFLRQQMSAACAMSKIVLPYEPQ